MKIIRPLVGVCVIGCALLASCASETKTSAPKAASAAAPSPGAVNSMCPIAGEPIDGKTMVSFNGKNVGFCCANCVKKWNGLSDADKQAKLATAMK